MKNNRFPALAVAAAVDGSPRRRVRDAAGRLRRRRRHEGRPGGAYRPRRRFARAGRGRAAHEAARMPTTTRARIYKGTGVVVKGQVPGGGGLPPLPTTQAAAGGGVVLNFEGADLREVIKNILGDILNESYTIDAVGRRSGHDPDDVRDSARRAAGDARDAAADERRDDGEGGRALQDPAERRRRARQRDAAARQFAARAAAGLLGADRPAALHRHARDDADTGAAREGRDRDSPRRPAQPARSCRAPSGSCSTCSRPSSSSTSTGSRGCRSASSRCRTPT